MQKSLAPPISMTWVALASLTACRSLTWLASADAVSALQNLGFKPQVASAAVAAALEELCRSRAGPKG